MNDKLDRASSDGLTVPCTMCYFMVVQFPKMWVFVSARWNGYAYT